TVITKQNLGVFLTATVGVTVALDTLRERRRIAQQLVTRAAVLFAGSLPPITAVVALFGARGSLGDLVQRVILDLRHVSQLPPTPVPLRYGHLDPGFIIFTYFPAALIHLTWERGLDILSHGALFVGIGHAVQAIYVAPLVAMVVACIQLWRGRRAAPAAEWSGLLLLLVFAASSYASMLYRADWTHLMNIAPPLLLVCAVVFARLLSGVRWAAWVAVIACAGWLMIGIAAALAVFVAYDMPLDTPRGRLLGPRREVRDAAQVLAYVDRQSPGEHILFFRADPLYYFLTNRRIPIMLELVMPALLGPEDDAAISRSLSHVDQVIYNPKRYSTLATPVTEYIPHTARTLASDFRAVEALSPTAVVLKRRARPRQTERVVADFWDDAAHLQASVEADGNGELPSDVGADAPAVEHANWLMYRVLAFTLRQHNLWQCVATTHRVDSDETVAAIPLLNPLTWLRGDPDFPADASGARFRISVRTADGVRHTLYERAQPLAVPPDELHLALDRFAGQQVEIGFCATLPPDGPPGSATALAGWAEPRIVRTVDY
ncbi:MAG TPA: hypothetical protein VMW56_09500, partial [Candidatus Margulisiibacteriota bacterium]|nr:hypothetical protein [Candidatus Margulisiibacteriota bacterium]